MLAAIRHSCYMESKPLVQAKTMLNLGHLISTVQNNCHISDARYAGNYTMCIFLLKMREYYRWEHEIPLSAKLPRAELGEWLVAREKTWETLENDSFREIPLDHVSADPFDSDAVNQVLLPQGYVYSAGYGLFSKPLFFLGQLVKREEHEGLQVLVSSCEYARDLVAPPAMTLNGTIFVRQDALRRYLWEKVEEWRWKQQEDVPMARAVAAYGNDNDLDRLLDRMTDEETEVAILHELGEVRAGELLGPGWEEMLAAIPRSKGEFLARAVRDHLADCLSTLPALLEAGSEGALHFYFANFSGMRRAIFPEAVSAYHRWVENGDLRALRELPARGADRWHETATGMLSEFRDRGDKTRAGFERFACLAAAD
jgi:hypothetical protein